MKNKIGIDIDGVISDIAGHVIDYASQMFECLIAPQQITSDRMETCTDLSGEQLTSIFRTPEFWRTLPLIPTTREWLREISQMNWEIVLMSDRFWYPAIEDDTRTWLTKHDIPFDLLEFARRAEKAQRSRDLGIRVFIEDQLSNANMLADVCEKVFLLDRTYNHGNLSKVATRVFDLQQITRYLADLG
jgi:uncharacterized HAD superfamily protein